MVFAYTGRSVAGYYLYPGGTGQVIIATTFTDARHAFDTTGKFIPTDRFRKLDLNAYVEIGVTDFLTAVIKPSITRASVASPGDALAADSSGSQVGARLHLATLRGIDFAVEASAVLPDVGLADNHGFADAEQGGAEIRALAGWAFGVGAWRAFIDAELAYRGHLGAAPDELRGDVTLGVRPRPRLLILAQSFNILTIGPARVPFAPFRQHKIELCAVYDFSLKWSGQLGLIATPAGANAPCEMGAMVAAWRRF